MRATLRISIAGLTIVSGLMLSVSGCSKTKPDQAPPAASDSSSEEKTSRKFETGRQVLEAMAAAYHRAKTYSDQGTVRQIIQSGEQKVDIKKPFQVDFVRPDKLRLKAYEATVVVDEKKLSARIEDLPGQVLSKPVPGELRRKDVYSDLVLYSAVVNTFAGPPPQVDLLLDPKPLSVLLQRAEEPVLTEPGTIDGRACYRVKVRYLEAGPATFWIDQETLILRRVNMPTLGLRTAMMQELGGEVDSISLIADFTDARFDAEIPPETFQFVVPAQAEVERHLLPAEAFLLGKKVPDFRFVDLEGYPVTPQKLSGKVAVLDFWATWCGPCKLNMPNLQRVYERYRDSGKVAFYAVSLDQPDVTNEKLADTLRQWKVQVPVLRDPDQTAVDFHFTGIPTQFLIGPDGVVQDLEEGVNPELAATLPEKIEKLLAGENLYPENLKKFQEISRRFEKMVLGQSERQTEEQSAPPVQSAPPSQPQTFRRTLRWKCPDVKVPGNILVLPQPNGPPRLAVAEGAAGAIAEVGADGKLLATHPITLDPKQELIANLRTAADAKGNRWIAAFASGYQRCFLLDKDWKQVLAYPPDALEHRHAGIADVALADLDGDGTPEMYVGYWGVVGVQAVTLEGKRLWTNRSLNNVASLAVGPPDAEGKRNLICTDGSGSLVSLDAEGQRVAEASVPDYPLSCLVGAELDGAVQWCGWSIPRPDKTAALGLTLTGKELWHYDLPPGLPTKPVDKIVPGRLSPAGSGVWIVPGPDGSIHFLAADGKPIDRFNYGAAIQGLATVEIDGRIVLAVAADDLEAWTIEK
ncbi:MAG: redoxin domain-containing protein [Pirellulales bacterium]|nr:redoxin domain-containing protein [Pirellulales bacterium]